MDSQIAHLLMLQMLLMEGLLETHQWDKIENESMCKLFQFRTKYVLESLYFLIYEKKFKILKVIIAQHVSRSAVGKAVAHAIDTSAAVASATSGILWRGRNILFVNDNCEL